MANKSLMKLWLLALLVLFLALSSAQSDSGSDDDSPGSPDSPDSDSPDDPTRSPSQQALNALIRACPCFEELGGDDSDALEEVREECLNADSSSSDSAEIGECQFEINTEGTESTLSCEEDQIVLDQAGQTCTLFEIQSNGDLEEEETIELSAAQTAICAAALAGVADDFECETPAPTTSPTAAPSLAPTAQTCEQFTLTTSVAFLDTGATAAEREAFALDLVTQATGNLDGLTVIIDNVLENAMGNAVIEYTLCAADPATVASGDSNVGQAVADGTVFNVGGVPTEITEQVPGTTTTEPPLIITTLSPSPGPSTSPSPSPTPGPSASPSPSPTPVPSPMPTPMPSPMPTPIPIFQTTMMQATQVSGTQVSGTMAATPIVI